MWTKLKEFYFGSSFVFRSTTLKHLYNTHLSTSNNSVKTYVSNIRSKAEELELMNAKMEDWQLTSILLMNLDGKFNDFVRQILIFNREEPKFDKVVTLLYEEDRRIKQENKAQASPGATKRFQTQQNQKKPSGSRNSTGRGRGGKNNGNSKNGSSGDGERPECYECTPRANGKWKRHWPSDCWTLHPERAPSNKPQANTTKPTRPDDFVESKTDCKHTVWTTFREEAELDHYEFWGLKRPEPSTDSPL